MCPLVLVAMKDDMSLGGPGDTLVHGRIDFELAGCGGLNPVGHSLGDDVPPLRNGAFSDADRASDRDLGLEMLQNDRLAHTPESTAC